MKRIGFCIGICLCAGAVLAGSSWETAAYRTRSGKLVQPGMTMVEVLRDAGEPTNKAALARGAERRARRGRPTQVWTYRGSDGLYAVTFVGDRVARIVVTPDR